MLPSVAAQLVAPVDVNCWVWPRVTDATLGEMVSATAGAAESVTAADAEPFGPVAVTVTDAEDGMVAGAV